MEGNTSPPWPYCSYNRCTPLEILRHDSDATTGSGGAAGLENPLDPGTAASGVVSETNNTTKVTGGTTTAIRLIAESFNVRAGHISIYPPLERPIWSNGQFLTIELIKTPADSLTMSGYIVYEEIGGDI